jgi:glycosyltransferase involved in cell wall biosynthesis
MVDEVILADCFSTDETVPIATASYPGLRVVYTTGHGKGKALVSGFAATSGEIVIAFDADESMNPADIPRLVAAINTGADVAKGSRFLVSGAPASFRRIGNRLITALANWCFGSTYTDVCCGLLAFRRESMPFLGTDPDKRHRGMPLGDGFEIDTLLSVRSHLAGLVVREIPIASRPRYSGTSKLRPIRDGIRIVTSVVIEWIAHRRICRSARL